MRWTDKESCKGGGRVKRMHMHIERREEMSSESATNTRMAVVRFSSLSLLSTAMSMSSRQGLPSPLLRS